VDVRTTVVELQSEILRFAQDDNGFYILVEKKVGRA
jgi:hypothetical protein